MKQTHAELVAGAGSPRDFPRPDLPEIVLAGRSNVGKSSLINRLAGRKNLARTSSTPGKTRTINFYRLSPSFLLVDLPGFGYAKAAKSESRQWKNLVEQYFRERSVIALVIHLVDARHAPTPLDVELQDWLDHLEISRMIVATKADKLSGNARSARMRELSSAFAGMPVVFCSAVTGMGCKEIWNRAMNAAGNRHRLIVAPKV